jgi:hypothetical protein
MALVNWRNVFWPLMGDPPDRLSGASVPDDREATVRRNQPNQQATPEVVLRADELPQRPQVGPAKQDRAQ